MRWSAISRKTHELKLSIINKTTKKKKERKEGKKVSWEKQAKRNWKKRRKKEGSGGSSGQLAKRQIQPLPNGKNFKLTNKIGSKKTLSHLLPLSLYTKGIYGIEYKQILFRFCNASLLVHSLSIRYLKLTLSSY